MYTGRGLRARRFRYIARIESAPDATARWGALLDRLGRQFDIDNDALDRVLDDAIDADSRAIALYKQMLGAAP